jgi:hypothetical protein
LLSERSLLSYQLKIRVIKLTVKIIQDITAINFIEAQALSQDLYSVIRAWGVAR